MKQTKTSSTNKLVLRPIAYQSINITTKKTLKSITRAKMSISNALS